MTKTRCPKLNFKNAAPLLASIVLSLGAGGAFAATTNYFTGFESAEGYTSGAGISNQPSIVPVNQRWVAVAVATNQAEISAGTNGNGILAGGLAGSGQAAYVGRTPLPAGYNTYVDVYRPLAIDPIAFGQPKVTFTTRVKLVDSTNGHWDNFSWNFYNSANSNLFKIEFDNDYYEINHYDSTNGYAFLGYYSAGVEYTLTVTMNFLSNLCNVSLDGVVLTNNMPLALKSTLLDLSAVSAIWSPLDRANPGNNYMLFDNYQIVSAPLTPQPPQLKVLTPGGNSAASLRLTGEDGVRFAVDGSTNLISWFAVATNTVSGGTANYTDPTATNKAARYYRARWVP